MKIYDNGELIHVDSAKDIIEHFGIKGMKWGQRRDYMMKALDKHDVASSKKNSKVKY